MQCGDGGGPHSAYAWRKGFQRNCKSTFLLKNVFLHSHLFARSLRTFSRIGENALKLLKTSTHNIELITRKYYIGAHMCKVRVHVCMCMCVCCISWKEDFCWPTTVTVTDSATEKKEEEHPVQIKHGCVICKGDPLTSH